LAMKMMMIQEEDDCGDDEGVDNGELKKVGC
jgi:hypothetical protein